MAIRRWLDYLPQEAIWLAHTRVQPRLKSMLRQLAQSGVPGSHWSTQVFTHLHVFTQSKYAPQVPVYTPVA
jgi:hypothetical protein